MFILDTFAGIGGVAKASLPGETIGFVEIDPKCQEVLASAFPGVPIHSDIRTFNGPEFGYFDLLTGGFPCQPFSRSGHGRHGATPGVVKSTDDRANLFLQLVRILDTCKPKAFLFENVTGLLTIKDKNGNLFLDTIINSLTVLGYSVKYRVYCPTQFGIPQQRKRVFLVGIRTDLNLGFIFPDPPSFVKSRVLDYLDDLVDPRYHLVNFWSTKTLGNASRVDALIEGLKFGPWDIPISGYKNKAHPISIIYGDTPSGKSRQDDRLYSVYGWSPTICTFARPAFDCPDALRILTPKECLRLQSFPDTHPVSSNDKTAYKQIGNAVNVVVVKAIVGAIRDCLKT